MLSQMEEVQNPQNWLIHHFVHGKEDNEDNKYSMQMMLPY